MPEAVYLALVDLATRGVIGWWEVPPMSAVVIALEAVKPMRRAALVLVLGLAWDARKRAWMRR